MPFWSEILLSIFANYRVAQLITLDVGPFGMFDRIRKFLGRRADNNLLWRELAELVHCPYCIGVWIACVPALLLAQDIPAFFLLGLGVAGAQAFLQSLTDGGETNA